MHRRGRARISRPESGRDCYFSAKWGQLAVHHYRVELSGDSPTRGPLCPPKQTFLGVISMSAWARSGHTLDSISQRELNPRDGSSLPRGPLAQMAARKSPLHIPDLAVERDYLKIPAVADLVKLGRIRTMLIVPMLMSKETVIGAITVSRTRVQPFTEKEIEMVADFAVQATIALETTRRERQYRDVQIQLAHANRVATIGQLSASMPMNSSSRLAQW